VTDLSAFAITRKWPAKDSTRLQLYSLPTPNGVKASIMLEETGLPYEPHLVSFDSNDQQSPEFLSLNPYGKIPAIIDPSGPGGKPIGLFESGAILIYLAEKTGQFMPHDAAGRYETIQWVMFQMGGVGPMFGQVGFFYKFGGKDYEDKRPRDRYVDQAKRLLAVINGAWQIAPGCWRGLLHRRYRHFSVGAQPGRVLWCRRAGRHRKFSPCDARSGDVRCAPGRCARLAIPARPKTS